MEPMDIDNRDSFRRSGIVSPNIAFKNPPARPSAGSQTYPQQPNIYQPLPNHPPQVIRLISISLPLPRISSYLLTAHLEVHPLDSAPSYNAISYVWGNSQSVADTADPNSLPAIICNNTLFPVTPNLHWALRRAAIASAKFASASASLSTPSLYMNTVSQPNEINSNRRKIYLWADAICINQSDLAERSSQVSFMGSIYARAQRVLVCMGDLPPGSPPGSNYALANLVNTLGPDIHAQGGPAVFRPPHHSPSALLNNTSALAWQALGKLMKRPWFGRVWVMQEVGMAPKEQQPVVLYGPGWPSAPPPPPLPRSSGAEDDAQMVSEFGYRDLMAVAQWATRHSELALRYRISSLRIHTEWAGPWTAGPADHTQRTQPPPPLTGEARASERVKRSKTFYDLIDHASLLSCHDPRDRIYAFLGHPLAPRRADGTPLITPDYAKDANELYLELAKVCLEEIVGLRALVTVEHTDESLQDGFPSWMTRWHVADIWNNISRLPSQVFTAGGVYESGYRPLIQGNNLMLEGTVADRLWMCFLVHTSAGSSATVHFSRNTSDGGVERTMDLGEYLSFMTSENVPSAYGAELNARLAAFAMTASAAANVPQDGLHAGHGPGSVGTTGTARWNPLGLSRLLAIDQFLKTHIVGSFDAAPPEAIAGLAFLRRLSGACEGRSFAITEKGRYCLVPKISREGDQICVVKRLDVPVVMRVDGTRCALLGEAYVFGLMHGEVMEMVFNRGSWCRRCLL